MSKFNSLYACLIRRFLSKLAHFFRKLTFSEQFGHLFRVQPRCQAIRQILHARHEFADKFISVQTVRDALADKMAAAARRGGKRYVVPRDDVLPR